MFYRPELTRYEEGNYSPFFKQPEKVSKLNHGLGLQLQCAVSKNFSVNAGINFVDRAFHARRIFDQSSIPPPGQSFTQELVTTKKINYRVLEFPLSVNYGVGLKKIKLLAGVGYLFDYLVSAQYSNSVKTYDGSYKKRYWLNEGSPFANAGIDYHLSRNWSLVFSYSYVFRHFNEEDPFLHSNWEEGRTMVHQYMYAMTGLKRTICFK